jgi:hypothetical protein
MAGRQRGQKSDQHFTSAELLEVAMKLRQHAGRFADTEIAMEKFLDRADELHAQAKQIREPRFKQ